VEIILSRRDVDLLASPTAVGVRRRMQKLMYVAYEMDQKQESGARCDHVGVAIYG
jgi:hypothetical protein